MTFTLVVKPSATAEAARIHAYREAEKPGSGTRFLEALTVCYA